ncbi:MAG: hypothetical protein JNJ75_10655 [Cyclobacteriaceae bacterium]|nr:hypothetical protein [Cyclobacteriaceae bacterium]
MNAPILENRFVQELFSKAFKSRDKKIFVSKRLVKLLKPEMISMENTTPYLDMIEFSAVVAKELKTTVTQVSTTLETLRIKGKEDEIKTILRDKKHLEKELNCAIDSYAEIKQLYSCIPTLTHQQVISKAIAHRILHVCFRYIPKIDSYRLGLIYQILREQKKTFDEQKEKPDEPGAIVEYHLGEIRLTSIKAFIKFVKRKKKLTLPKGLIHGHTGKASNNYRWTEELKWIVTLFALSKPTRVSASEIRDAIENLIEDNPELRDKHGIVPLSEPSILNFLNEESKAYISFAKDEPLEFKRKIVGVLKFDPPSAPMVKIGIDGYVLQCVSKGSDDAKRYVQVLAVIIKDLRTMATLGAAVSETENSETVLKAWRAYFQTTKGEMAREVAFDGHLAYQSKSMENLLSMLKRDGVDIKVSKTANYQGRYERSNLDFQDKYLSNSISYIGPGIKSKGVNAHPSKIFKLELTREEYLKDMDEMKRIVLHLIMQEANFGTLRKRAPIESPMGRFRYETHNPLKTYNDSDIAYMTHERHISTVKGCGVLIKKDKEVFIYNRRDFNTATNLNGKSVDVYINQEERQGVAHIFRRGTIEYLGQLYYLATIPEALFDRSEAHSDMIKMYGKDVAEITDQLENSIVDMQTEVTKFLKGKDYREYLNAAKIKKRIDTNYIGYQLGVSEPKPEPEMKWSNSKKSRIKRRNKLEDKNLKGDLFDTY